MRLQGSIAEKDRVIAGPVEEMAGMLADYRTELAGRDALIRMLGEKMEGTESDNKSLAASDRAHNSAHAPSPATRTWHAERRKREAVRKRHAGRPPSGPRAGALGTRA